MQNSNFGNFNEAEALVDRPKTPKAEIDVSVHKQSPQQIPEFPFGGMNPYPLGRSNLNFLTNFGGEFFIKMIFQLKFSFEGTVP